MRDWIAGAMAVLGTLLVLAGAAVVVLKALGPGGSAADPVDTTVDAPRHSPSSRVLGKFRRISAADRLIVWGIVLLVLAAIASGAISFSLSATAGTQK